MATLTDVMELKTLISKQIMQNIDFSSNDYKIIKRESIYRGFFHVEKIQLSHKLFSGGWSHEITRELLHRGDAVAILPYDPVRDEIVLVEQFRIGLIAGGEQPRSPWLFELVAGMVEAGEDLEAVAVREAAEEANCQVRDLLPIFKYYPSPGGCSEFIQVYCGRTDTENLGGIYGCEDHNEDILVHTMSREEGYRHLERGDIADAQTIIGLQWLQLNYRLLQSDWRLI